MVRGWSLARNYAVDLTLLAKVRDLSDGLDFVELVNALHWYREDHNPRWEFRLELFNWCLFGVEVYNVNHVPEVAGARVSHAGDHL